MNANDVDRSNVSAPISREQKTRLVLLAREAYQAQPGLVRGQTKFDLWRHQQAIKCCGRRVSEALQGDFLPLKAHFLNLAGKPVAAMRAHMRRETEPQRVALHKLTRECAAKGLSIAYAATICHAQYRCALEEANEKQLWRLFFTIRNRKPKAAAPATTNYADINDDNIPF